MSHELEIIDGVASFAYNVGGGAPWHGLGTAVDGQQTAEEMLRIAKADYDVSLRPVFVQNDEGEYVEVKERFATTRTDKDGTLVPFEVMKNRYHVVQNAEVLDKALQVVGASEGDAIMETVGVLKDGRQFFAAIDLGSLVIDPTGVNDKISRYLLVHTSHDGTAPITYSNTDVRAVCANTVRFGQDRARSTFKARHTPNVEEALTEARKVLEISLDWAEAFEEMAEEMLSIPVPAGSGKIDTVLDKLWPVADADTERKVHNRDDIVTNVRHRFNNERNAGMVGYNGWGLYNSIVEFLDHGRGGTATSRAMASMDSASLVSARKVQAQKAVMSLV